MKTFLQKNTKIILLALLALVLTVRIPSLGSRSLWYDEAFSILFSRTGPAAMLQGTLGLVDGTAADVHPLLYYTLLWAWMLLVGQKVIVVRFLSVLIHLALLILVWYLMQELFGLKQAVLAGLLFSFAPFQVHYGQEARMYALLSLWLVSATLCVWKGMVDGRYYPWVAFGIFAALAMYTHVLAVFYLIPLGLSPLFFRKLRLLRSVFLSALIAIVLYLPWGLQLPAQISKVERAYWIAKPTLVDLVQTILSFISGMPIHASWLPVILFCAILVIVLAGVQTFRAAREGDPHVEKATWLIYLSAAPVLLLFLVSQVRPLFVVRGLVPSGVIFLLWLAWALTPRERRRLESYFTIGCLAFAFAIGLFSRVTYRGFPYAPFENVNDYIISEIDEGGIVLHSNKITMLPAFYYDESLQHTYIADHPGAGSDTLALPTQEVLGLFAQPDALSAVGDAQQVFFVMFAREIGDYEALGVVNHPHLTWLIEHYSLEEQTAWDDLSLYRFESREDVSLE
ncbi:MAG TPA: glycosyltransferase family 39 protein [Anaerolineales bacterium]|nr:glycosyltransferase family 39 protein [Anaerolineales bacterium]